MNKIYRLMWNAAKEVWVVVSEKVRACGARPGVTVGALAATALLAAGGAAFALDPAALPTGGSIASGSGTITQSDSRMIVNQASQQMIANWSTFNIGQNAEVRFNQPNVSATALNRIMDQNPSQILGSLSANGRVWLINPSGIIFGRSAQVDVGGLVASSLAIIDENFLTGSNLFEKGDSAGAVRNQGNIRAMDGGYVAFLSPVVANEGSVSAPGGTVALAAGDRVSLDFTGDRLVSFTIEQGAVDALVENRGLIKADGGLVMLTARAADRLTGSVVNNSGVVEARSLESRGGRIILDAEGGMTTVSGVLDVASSDGTGGRIVATGDRVLVESGAHLTASGAAGGGEVLVGGGWQGKDASIRQATGTVVLQGALLEANATDSGNGGTVVAWSDITRSDSVTRAYGTFEANGGPNGGNGGRIETSGHWLDVTGSRGSAAATHGTAGEWLLDPYDVTISGANANGSFTSSAGTDTWTPSSTGSTILSTDIAAKLESGTNVTVTTGTTGAEIGDITVSSAITKGSGDADVTLTLQAANSIVVDQAIANSGGTGKLHVVLDADNNSGTGDGAGIILLNADIDTGGGNLSFGTGRTATINGVSTLVGGDVYVAGSGARALSTNGGDVAVKGEMIVANTNGLTIDSNGGDVHFSGLLNSGNRYAGVNAPSTNWSTALTNAKSGSGDAVSDTYLATITSRLENAVAGRAVGYQPSWLGGRRVTGIGTNSLWRWVTGPEGLEDGGKGRGFFTQSTSGSGTAYNGGYSNWNSGEPNNYTGSTAGTDLSKEYESILQFTGNLGNWNDLPGGPVPLLTPQTLNYYVRETNLAASPLTVSAGAGTVTFAGAVGTSKALTSLSVTAATIAINGGAITTEGSQVYSGDVTLGAASTTLTQITANTDFTLTDRITGAVANAGLTISTNGNVTLDNAGNDFTGPVSVTGGAKNVVIVDANALTLGSVTASGTVDVSTLTGDLTVTQNIATSDETANAVRLNAGKNSAAGIATGGNIVVSGSPTISTGAGGRATLYTGSVSGSTGLSSLIGSGSGRFRYNSDEAAGNFTDAIGSGSFAIYREQPTVTITATNDSKTYNGLAYAGGNGVTYSGFANGDTAAAFSGTLAYGGGSQGATNVGSYAITPSGYANGLGYALAYADGSLSITPAALTVTANDASKTYGQTLTFTGSEFSSSGLQNGETIGSVTLASTGAAATAVVSGSPYAITAAGATGGTFSAGNYAITYADGTLTITPRPITVTASDQSRVYGAVNPTSGPVSLTAGSLVNGDTLGTASVTSTATGITAAGQSAALTPSSQTFSVGSAGNYAITYADGTLTITPRPITVTASDQSRIYGTANPTSGPVTLTAGSLVNGDTLGTATVSSTATGTTAAGQTAPLTPESQTFNVGSAGNYAITYADGTLTITPRPITVTASDQSRVYGAANPTSGPVTLTAGSLVNGDTLGKATVSSTATGITAAGQCAALTPSSQTFSVGSAGNYAITYADGTLTITPRPITVTASDQSRIYGAANPTSGPVTLSAGSLVNGDTLGAATVSSTATGTTAAGQSAALTPSSQTFSVGSAGNYAITYADGTLTITPRPITVTASDQSRVYGAANPTSGPVTLTAGSLVNGDTLGTASVTSTATGTTAAGQSTALTPSSQAFSVGNASNYTITYTDGTLTITPAPLTITANDASKIYGQTETFTGIEFSASGLKNGETVGSVDLASAGAEASAGVSGSPYAITAAYATGGTFDAANYAIAYVDGTLTVTAAPEPPPSLTSIQQSVNGTQQELAGTVAGNSPALGPGSGSATLDTLGTTQLVTETLRVPGSTILSSASANTPVSFSAVADGTTTMALHSANPSEPMTDVNSLPLFLQAAGSTPVMEGMFVLKEGGSSLSLAPTGTGNLFAPPSTTAAAREIPFSLSQADGNTIRLAADVTADGFLVISVPEGARIVDRNQAMLMAMAVVKRELRQELKELKGILIQSR